MMHFSLAEFEWVQMNMFMTFWGILGNWWVRFGCESGRDGRRIGEWLMKNFCRKLFVELFITEFFKSDTIDDKSAVAVLVDFLLGWVLWHFPTHHCRCGCWLWHCCYGVGMGNGITRSSISGYGSDIGKNVTSMLFPQSLATAMWSFLFLPISEDCFVILLLMLTS